VKTTDWKYDFASLPHWDNREKFPFVYDSYFEIPESDTLCCLYAITEVSMQNYLGFLAILRNKDHPELVLNVAEEFSFCVNFSVSQDGNLIFLQPSIYNQRTARCVRPILILDIQKNRFAYIKSDNHNPCYTVIQKTANVFVVQADENQRKADRQLAALHGRIIRTRWLKWYRMNQLAALPEMI